MSTGTRTGAAPRHGNGEAVRRAVADVLALALAGALPAVAGGDDALAHVALAVARERLVGPEAGHAERPR